MKNAFWCLCIGIMLLLRPCFFAADLLESRNLLETLLVWNWPVLLQMDLVHIGVFLWLFRFYRRTGSNRLEAAGISALAVELGFIVETLIMVIASDGVLPPAVGIYCCFPFVFVFTVQIAVCTLFRTLYMRQKEV